MTMRPNCDTRNRTGSRSGEEGRCDAVVRKERCDAKIMCARPVALQLRQAVRGRNVVVSMWSGVSHARRLLPVPGSRVWSRAPAKRSTIVAHKRQQRVITVTDSFTTKGREQVTDFADCAAHAS